MKEHELILHARVVGHGVVLVSKDTPEGVGLAMGQSYIQLAVCLLSLDP